MLSLRGVGNFLLNELAIKREEEQARAPPASKGNRQQQPEGSSSSSWIWVILSKMCGWLAARFAKTIIILGHMSRRGSVVSRGLEKASQFSICAFIIVSSREDDGVPKASLAF
jgi:hypothetical protein